MLGRADLSIGGESHRHWRAVGLRQWQRMPHPPKKRMRTKDWEEKPPRGEGGEGHTGRLLSEPPSSLLLWSAGTCETNPDDPQGGTEVCMGRPAGGGWGGAV